MTLIINRFILYTLAFSAIVLIYSSIHWLGVVLLLLLVLAFAAQHRKNKSKVRWQKHSDKRAGKVYDVNQNKKKGDKNKKYIKPKNPNKKNKTQDNSNENETL